MRAVIIGGNGRMQCVYTEACASYGCKAKIFMDNKGVIRQNRITGSFDFVHQYGLA